MIDAYWDTRNLGVKCGEIEFDRDDVSLDKNELLDACSRFEYVAAKVPSGASSVLSVLQEAGFVFVECSINFLNDLSEVERPFVGDGSSKGLDYSLAETESDRDYILSRVGEGLFATDRIYLDPCFTHEQASARYVNWIRDEIGRGADLYNVYFGSQKAGFFAYKEIEPHVSYPFLIGLYPEFRGKRLGAELIASSLRASKDRGCVSSSTIVSSNNLPVVRSQERVGSYIKGMNYVLVWHKEEGGRR